LRQISGLMSWEFAKTCTSQSAALQFHDEASPSASRASGVETCVVDFKATVFKLLKMGGITHQIGFAVLSGSILYQSRPSDNEDKITFL